ncbi:lysine N(6)-hydroxylase/L-ornithine N(5)-oxygenase family protein [Peribacillus frigoritolerans]|uniref:lysine N(6)-hydroxylase/L-ornithine N(5)-oxygenase family protein n=1 Tax=Peribacillus frigoritolerans TaxID=450367 RepID=UPI002B246B67|nr:lysine N(6)-hydroxylase/L-ornithine N(5)-oxygenase family protein [Peribacillus frigoritolerans]MEB2491843.1 lysine N(6)-hydroxylase/L-ornithine N(5)-oxygenase family protein [Peribacillus frigoritolerans]
MEKQQSIYDLVGVGIGPFNLGLAALLEKTPELNAVFFEKKGGFNWHEGMLLEGTTLQVPFFADLVSMADVTSPYSYLNYLQQHDRLYHFYFLEKFLIPRKEYNDYCRWAAHQLDSCRFGKAVEAVEYIGDQGEPCYQISVRDAQTQKIEVYYSRHVVMGIGSSPTVPSAFQPYMGESILHSAEYLRNKENILKKKSVTVVGSGQSAAEVFLDLLNEQEEYGYQLNWYTRSKGFFPMEYSKLGLEYFTPDYLDFFYRLPQEKKDEILPKQDLLYKGISATTIAAIFDKMYEKSIGNAELAIELRAMTEVAAVTPAENGWQLKCRQWVEDSEFDVDTEAIVFGTGYKSTLPAFLETMEDHLVRDDLGRLAITKDYKVGTAISTPNHLFIQNGEIHTHGVGAPDLGLGAFRNSIIINQLAGKEVYPSKPKGAFQSFRVKKPVMAY